MESLAYLYSAAAYESNEPVPKLRSFDTLGSVLPSSAWISIQPLLAAVLAISVTHSALAATTGVVNTSGDPLNVRTAPNGDVVSSVANGSRVELTGRSQDGFLELADGTWVATEWLSLGSTPASKSFTTSSVSATSPSASASPTRPPTSGADRTVAYITTDTEAINVRTAPGGQVVGTLPDGTRVELTGRESQGFLERTNATWLDKRYVSANRPNVQSTPVVQSVSSAQLAPVKAAPQPSPQRNQLVVSPVKPAPQSPPVAVSQTAPVRVAAGATAQTVGYVRTTGNPLNVRNAPGGQVISTLPNGARVELTGRENTGYLERNNGTWLDKRYVAYTPSTNQVTRPPSPTGLPSPSRQPSPAQPRPNATANPVTPTPALPTATPNNTSATARSSATVRTTGSPLNVRSAPGGTVVGSVPNGSRVDLTGRRSGEWAERSNGTWVASAWLTVTPVSSPSPAPTQAQSPASPTNPVVSNVPTALIRTNGSPLNVRSAPGGALVGSVPNGSQVELTGRRSGEWAERSNGTWVASAWLVPTAGAAVSNSPANSNPNSSTSGSATASAPPVGSDVSSGTIRTNGSPLNVRNSPNGSVIGVVANGSQVALTGRSSAGWVQLAQGGWISSEWVAR